MAEKRKESEKGKALLADDIGKDFHTSPMAEDDQMDIDFSTAAKQNVEPAKFGNMFDDLNFDPSFGRIAKKTKTNQEPELSPSLSGSLVHETLLKETIGASEEDTTSKFDSQLCGEPNFLRKEKSRTSLTDLHLPSISEIAKDQATNLEATPSNTTETLINTSISEQMVLLELEKPALTGVDGLKLEPTRMDGLSPSEKSLAWKAVLATYVSSDDENERKRLEKDIECSRERISMGLERAHAKIYDISRDFFLRPFHEAIEVNTAESIKHVVKDIDGVLMFGMMFRAPCRMIIAEVKNFEMWCKDNDFHPIGPSRIYEHGVVLSYFGLDRMIGQLVEGYLQPIIDVFFGFVGKIDDHFSFCVEFGADKHNHIDPTYADNSSITFKLCLSDPKTSLGGDLTFGDTRCASHEQKDDRPLSTISLDMGHAVMHCGRHRNGVLPVDVEKKVYLIIWMKSSEFEEMNAFKRRHPEWSTNLEWCTICKLLKKNRADKIRSDLVQSLRTVSPDSSGSPSN